MLPIRETKLPRGKAATKEDLDFEIRFFEGIAHHDPDFIEALQILGDAYTKTGQWEKGLKIDERLSRLCPDNSLVFYNLACSYSLLNDIDKALAVIKLAIQTGYNHFSFLEQDEDLANLLKDERFIAYYSKITKDKPRLNHKYRDV